MIPILNKNYLNHLLSKYAMEYWHAWAIIIILIIAGAGGGFGIAYYLIHKDTGVDTGNTAPLASAQEPTPVVPQQKTPESKSTAQKEATPSSVLPSQTSSSAKKIIDKYDTSVNGYLYYYASNKFLIKNNKIKIIFNDVQELAPGIPFNTVYLDTKTKEAFAFCEDVDDASGRKCRDKEKIPTTVQYNQFAILTPGDWINKLRSAISPSIVEKSQTLFNRNVDEVSWDDLTLYVDHTYGIPVEAIQGKNKYDYLQLAVNQVSAQDVTRPDQ